MSFEVTNCIKKMHHSGFVVKDLDRSLRFYQDTLKMDLKMRWIETAEQCDVWACVCPAASWSWRSWWVTVPRWS